MFINGGRCPHWVLTASELGSHTFCDREYHIFTIPYLFPFPLGHTAKLHFPASLAGGRGPVECGWAEGVPLSSMPVTTTQMQHKGRRRRQRHKRVGVWTLQSPLGQGSPRRDAPGGIALLNPWVSEKYIFTELTHSHFGVVATAVAHPG